MRLLYAVMTFFSNAIHPGPMGTMLIFLFGFC